MTICRGRFGTDHSWGQVPKSMTHQGICDVELGIHTLHMRTGKVLGDPTRQDSKKKQDQYFSNVALKLNTKLGGANHKLDPGSLKWLRARKTMMDVTHPGPGSIEGMSSIAAVVASIDDRKICQERLEGHTSSCRLDFISVDLKRKTYANAI
ncbi:hypothetical protein F5I97DRAFT_818066 [Phlebopus sp. FC_14]|nr:hypothetical protein F5I97DRAFT_818066 [Phlebopus sp. FC_14]